jgi:hypothetical protein
MTTPVSPSAIGSSVAQGFDLFTSVTHGIEEKATQLKAIASPTLKAIASPKLLDRVSSLSLKKTLREGASSFMSLVSSGINKDYEIHNSGEEIGMTVDLHWIQEPIILLLAELGKGHFGVVKPAIHRKSRQVVIEIRSYLFSVFLCAIPDRNPLTFHLAASETISRKQLNCNYSEV